MNPLIHPDRSAGPRLGRFAALAALVVLILIPALCAGAPPAGAPNVKFAGARSSSYGIRPFPSPEGWVKAMKTMSGHFPGSTPTGVWIVGRLHGQSKGISLEFPRPKDAEDLGPMYNFAETDKHEPYLNQFDANGIKVFLQIEPGYADVEKCIDLVLNQYKHHPSVIGFGIDIEWFQNAKTDSPNAVATDDLVKAWDAKIKSHNPKYRLFVKHFFANNLPPTYRGDVVFVDDGQQFKSLEDASRAFKSFADFFYPATVMFQIGYRADKPLWSTLEQPVVKTWGEKLASETKQDCGIIWVDFTLRDVVPTE